MEGDAQTGYAQHGEIVGSVAHGNGLGYVYLLYLGNETEQFGLALAVYDIAHITAGQLAVFYLQFVGVHVVYAVLLLQVFAEIGEAAGEDGYLVAVFLEDVHQAVHSLGDGEMFGNVLHDGDIQSFQEGYAFAEAFHKIYLAPHGTLGDGFYLVAHAGTHGQFVNDFRLDEGGVHVEADEAAHAAVHVVQLEGEVYLQFRSHLHQLGLHLFAVFRGATDGKLDAGFGLGLGFIQRNAARQTLDGIDVHPLFGENTCSCGNLAGRELAAQEGQDISVLALHVHPVFVLFGADGVEAYGYTQGGSFEEQFLHDEAGMLFLGLAKNAERKGAVYVGLADI